MTPLNSNLNFGQALEQLKHKIQTDTQHLHETEQNLQKAVDEKKRLQDLMKVKELEIEKAKGEITAAKTKIAQLDRDEAKLNNDVRKLKADELINKRQLDEANRQFQEASRNMAKK